MSMSKYEQFYAFNLSNGMGYRMSNNDRSGKNNREGNNSKSNNTRVILQVRVIIQGKYCK